MPKVPAGLFRWILNYWPCIRGGGGRVLFIAPDYSKLVVRLPFNWRTRNAFGTIYGGSMYASTDPFFTLMLAQILGRDFVVWDKGAAIRFRRPSKETLFAEFTISPERLAQVKAELNTQGETSFTWTIQLQNKAGLVFAEIDKVIYAARKDFYAEKQKKRAARGGLAPLP